MIILIANAINGEKRSISYVLVNALGKIKEPNPKH